MKATILLAEGDGAVRRMVARVLDLAGYTVLAASTGGEALDHFRTRRPDLVLLSLELPALGASEVFEQMNHSKASAPVLAMTGATEHEPAVQRGADALMEKPLDLPLLLETIERLLARGPVAPHPSPGA